jgi:hypothetical protein
VKPPLGYRKFLSENETVNAKLTEYVLQIKNIGNESVPRGHLKIVLMTPFGMGEYTLGPPLIEMAALEPSKTFSLKRSVYLTFPGHWFLTLKFELAEKEEQKEKKKIEYYQFERATPDLEKWLYPIYAVDRHQLDLISRLEKLMKRKVQ